MGLKESKKYSLMYQFHLLQAIRNFFQGLEDGFVDVITPPMVQHPGLEPHIHPFGINSQLQGHNLPLYLQTSPEFHMKELLSLGFANIFTLCYSFRDEPMSPIHRPQFIMLEWYRAHTRYEKIMEDCEDLFLACAGHLQEKGVSLKWDPKKAILEKMTIQNLFLEYLGLDILAFPEKQELRRLIERDFKEVPLPAASSLLWEDYYHLLFLNLIEPKLADRPYLLLYEYPRELSALSTIKKEDPRVCERFEIYLAGTEICNCYNELTDWEAQKDRALSQAQLKKELYHYELPDPETLLAALKTGIPPSAGIALGVSRLLMALADGVEDPFYPQ